MKPKEAFSFSTQSLSDVLIDLAVRFVLNCPPEDISTAVRLFFQLEEAHWFYEDFAREQNPALPSLKIKTFVTELYKALPLMNYVCSDPKSALLEFQEYKSSIPVRGGILVNEKLNKVLMVRAWTGSSWGFPRGKINKEEDDAVCAIREVLEETGFDMSAYVDRREYIEITYRGKNIRLYVVSGIPESTYFETQTRKEISKIEWVPVNKLPVFSRKEQSQLNFYMVTPFMNGLRSYIARKKGYATKLSKSETGALKNLLGISTGAHGSVHNDEATAQHLLAMLRSNVPSTEPVVSTITDSSPAAAPAAPTPPVTVGSGLSNGSGAIPTSASAARDRDILLNLLKEGTPDVADHSEPHTEVESAQQILALLQREIATEKAVSPPAADMQPIAHLPASEPATRPEHAPALPPNWMLESLVSSRRSNLSKKPSPQQPIEHRPSGPPSKNALLNLLHKPKQAESARLMALLKPMKPPAPAATPKRSALMDLLEQSGSETGKQTASDTSAASTSQVSKSTSDLKASENTSLQTITAVSNDSREEAPARESVSQPKAPPKLSSLLGLLNPAGANTKSHPASGDQPVVSPATNAAPDSAGPDSAGHAHVSPQTNKPNPMVSDHSVQQQKRQPMSTSPDGSVPMPESINERPVPQKSSLLSLLQPQINETPTSDLTPAASDSGAARSSLHEYHQSGAPPSPAVAELSLNGHYSSDHDPRNTDPATSSASATTTSSDNALDAGKQQSLDPETSVSGEASSSLLKLLRPNTDKPTANLPETEPTPKTNDQ